MNYLESWLNMEAKFINPVLTSMVNVLSTMAQLEPKPGRPTLKDDSKARGVVSAVISMTVFIVFMATPSIKPVSFLSILTSILTVVFPCCRIS